ncbi:hypothetical protein [Qipengyuania sphaerica]|uniref:hypothetical protein n=1 Tax=Qipengyuania sphaerica TaxID=2867243 RepID=UPI001C86D602|nr:hypothetical protein [Qipengyuania sphaerica]MBX7541722.1 hypothetical protein [Qipengyuania sphaerica]
MKGLTLVLGVLVAPAAGAYLLGLVHPLLSLLVIIPMAIVAALFAIVGLSRSQWEIDTALSGLPMLASSILGGYLSSTHV